MRTRTLTQEEALALIQLGAFNDNYKFVVNGHKHAMRYISDRGVILVGDYARGTSAKYIASVVVDLILLGATIEVTEHDVFDDPAFEKWDVSECRLKAFRGNFSVWSNGKCFFYAMLVNEVNPSDIPELAAAVNRLVEVGEVSE